MARSTADACNIVRRWDHDGKRYEASQNKKQKVATGLLRESPYGPSRFWDRFTVVFCASFATGHARLKDFTPRVLNKCIVLDVQINPTLPHYNECPLLDNLFAALWRHAAALSRRGHLLHDLITQVFLRSLQYGSW